MAEMFEQGAYKGMLLKAEFGQAKTGTAQWCLSFDVGGNLRIVFLSCSDASMEYTIEKMARLGFNGDTDNPQFSPAVMEDHIVDLACKHETYQGKTQEKWDIRVSFTPTPASSDAKTRFKHAWKQSTAGVAKKPTPTLSKPSAPAASKPKAGPPPEEPPFEHKGGSELEFNKDAAWDAWSEAAGGNPDVAKWKQAVQKVAKESNMPEGKFGHEQWFAVSQLSVPGV